MSITDELRTVAAKTECANGRCEKLYRGDLDRIADRIDAEHESAARWYSKKLREASRAERKLLDENAKLRELVRDMYKAFVHGNCYRWCEFKEPCNYISDGRCQWYDRMRELGVEVDA